MLQQSPITTERILNQINKSPTESGEGTGSWCLEIQDAAQVIGNQNSQHMYDQSVDGPYQELTKNAKQNRYLTKIAMAINTGPSNLSKVGLGLSAASLGVGLANFHNSRITAMANQDKVSLERKSLGALNKINDNLTTSQLHPSKMGNTAAPGKM